MGVKSTTVFSGIQFAALARITAAVRKKGLMLATLPLKLGLKFVDLPLSTVLLKFSVKMKQI